MRQHPARLSGLRAGTHSKGESGRSAFALFALVLLCALSLATVPASAACPERQACKGCGCKGGPGYRGPNGKCVGFRDLDRVCGVPPETRCVFENAPGTGANRECALAPKQKKGPEADPALQPP
ncbi:hypothetical protein GGR25_000992 [Kaistia hirudinis]|uniref:Uncharacterized protein n=1 Tax=Kaistia hirudinis TaxID=1293440 RepID=A0A840AL41_9HYPH|nr:hypothetical protein [Kaistia hirudinis]MBB3929973.1 hypothetical protein [Kaistia hirudinis]